MNRPPGGRNPHQALVAAARAYLTWSGAWTFKVLGGLGQQPGVPDLLAAFPPDGRLVAVECKTGAGRLTTAQCEEKASMEAAGVVYVLCRELEDLEGALIRSGLVARPRLLDWGAGGAARRSSRYPP
jgi:hypothetical protein